MPRDAEPGLRRRTEAVPPGDPAPDVLDETIETQLADLVAYCRELTGEETAAVSTAQSVVDAAHSLLSDPEVLRAWLFALARRKALATRPGVSAHADSPQPQEVLDLVHRHGIRPQDLPVVLGIPATETAELLAAAEAENDSRAAQGSDDDSDRFSNNGWHDGTGRNDWAEPHGTAGQDDWSERDDTGEQDNGRRLDDLEGLMRTPPDSAGRHAARRAGSGGWRALTSGRTRLAAATAIVVAIIGVGAAYLAESAHGAGSPGPAGLQSSHHPSPAANTPTGVPSPTPTASPSHSPAPTKSVTVVHPAPAPTSTKPKPPPTPSTQPSESSPSTSASATPSATSSPP